MSLYAEYITERTNDKIIEEDFGFVSYRYLNDGYSVYIVDIYVKKERRREHLASKLADKVVCEAKKMGAKELIGTVVPSTKGSTASLGVLIGYGMHLHAASNDLVVFRKGI